VAPPPPIPPLLPYTTLFRSQGDYVAADAYLADLREHVYSFCESLSHSIRVLWSRINNEFGYVGSLGAKIRENELAQTQVSELLRSEEHTSELQSRENLVCRL